MNKMSIFVVTTPDRAQIRCRIIKYINLTFLLSSIYIKVVNTNYQEKPYGFCEAHLRNFISGLKNKTCYITCKIKQVVQCLVHKSPK